MPRLSQGVKLEQVRRALRYWDPLGVIQNPAEGSGPGDDEYDSYAAGLLRQLEQGREARWLAQHLARLRGGWLGEDEAVPSELEQGLAAQLVAWQADGFRGEPNWGDGARAGQHQ
jgi:hypothetical protein